MKLMLRKICECFIGAKISFIMTLICLVIFLYFFSVSDYLNGNSKNILLLLAIIPFIIYLILTILTNKYFFKEKIKMLLDIISISLILFVGCYFFIIPVVAIFYDSENPIKDIKYYDNYIMDNKKLLKVFPEEIPEDVIDVKFQFSPGILQSGTDYVLYYKDNNLNVNEFDSKYKEKSEWIGNINSYKEKEGLFTGAFSATPIKDKDINDFKIYLIESYCDDSGYCNHGNYLFVAINENTKEVIYKSSDW